MTVSEIGNCYWSFDIVTPSLSGLRVLAEVRPGDPLREGVCVTVAFDEPVPVVLVKDVHGQFWSIAATHMWSETEAPDA